MGIVGLGVGGAKDGAAAGMYANGRIYDARWKSMVSMRNTPGRVYRSIAQWPVTHDNRW